MLDSCCPSGAIDPRSATSIQVMFCSKNMEQFVQKKKGELSLSKKRLETSERSLATLRGILKNENDNLSQIVAKNEKQQILLNEQRAKIYDLEKEVRRSSLRMRLLKIKSAELDRHKDDLLGEHERELQNLEYQVRQEEFLISSLKKRIEKYRKFKAESSRKHKKN